ncbi:MAG TPA: DMT family transporter [Anaerolineales bacterium]|nr:DMT family transporter [Anaerolineales bacterium]
MSTQPQHLRAYLALLAGILCLGFSAIFVRAAEAPGVVSSVYRMAIAGVVFAFPFFRQNRNGNRLPRRGVALALLSGLFFGGDLFFWSEGIMISGATNPTLMANTAPIWVGLGALVVFREKLSGRFWLGLGIALAGVAVVLGVDSLQQVSLGLGTLYGLIAGMFYGGFFLLAQRGRALLRSISFFWISVLGSTALLLVVGLLQGVSFSGYPLESYLYFLAGGLVSQVAGWFAINYAQGHLPATVISPTLLGQPVITAFAAVVMLGESLGTWQSLGGAAILGGIYLVHRARLPDATP